MIFQGLMTGLSIVSTGTVLKMSGWSQKMSGHLRKTWKLEKGTSCCYLKEFEDDVSENEFSISDLETSTNLRYRTHTSFYICTKCGHSFEIEE